MLIYDLSDKDKVFDVVINHLRNLGVKNRIKKSARKADHDEKPANNSKKVFNIPLTNQRLDGVQLSSGAIVYVPIFVKHAVAHLEKSLHQEGLFRRGGSQARLKELVGRINSGQNLGNKHHPIDVANCLKKYFRDLPEPIIPYAYHDLFVRCGMIKDVKVEAILMACLLLPISHLNTLAFFMDFLRKVAQHEDQNKMGTENLAKVVGPNIMPLRETTITAMHNRLNAHLAIVQILIENSQQIGALSKDIMDNIQAEAYCSSDTLDNDRSREDRFKEKKKKHRSGSLTRMFNGLRKIVGKNESSEHITPINENQMKSAIDNSENSPSKACKKRKNGEVPVVAINNKKKRRSLDHILGMAPNSMSSITSSVKDENLLERNVSFQKFKVRKYFPHNIHLNGFPAKIDKPKILGLSLDRFVSRSKQKIHEFEAEKEKSPADSPIERRWSTSSGVLAKKRMKKRRLQNWSASSIISSPSIKKQKAVATKTENDQYDRIFMDAEINLSDENGEDLNTSQRSSKRHPSLSKKIKTPRIYEENEASSRELDEEYIKIPKSEYEAIKNRVTAMESRISQELGTIFDHNFSKNCAINTLNQVQSEYEKTLGEASIETITSTDHLARRLSKELKIRRSAEHKVIRSPSARRISSLRRRSQEKPIIGRRRLSRMSSWHVSEKANDINSTPKSITDKSESYQDAYSFCSEETKARLNYLQQHLCTLISDTDQHTGSMLNAEENLSIITLSKSTPVRRVSSFHGNESNFKFDNRLDKLKKVNGQIHHDKQNDVTMTEIGSEKRITWKNASTYLDAETPLRPTFNASVIQTGRASVAKLRTQNAGMVLAKARLFDHTQGKTTPEIIMEHQQKRNLVRNLREPRNSVEIRRKKCKSPKTNGLRLKSDSPSDLNANGCQSIEKRRLLSPTSDQENKQKDHTRRESIRNLNSQPRFRAPTKNVCGSELVNRAAEIMNVTGISNTPHIKKPLSTKTPRSARSLVRKSVIDSRRTPLKAVPTITTPKRQSPRYGYKSRQITKHIN